MTIIFVIFVEKKKERSRQTRNDMRKDNASRGVGRICGEKIKIGETGDDGVRYRRACTELGALDFISRVVVVFGTLQLSRGPSQMDRIFISRNDDVERETSARKNTYLPAHCV